MLSFPSVLGDGAGELTVSRRRDRQFDLAEIEGRETEDGGGPCGQEGRESKCTRA